MKDKATLTIKIRISPNEMKILRSRAERYYNGNLSKCIKEAIREHKTKKPHRSGACE
jgi:hypothetical protein